MRLFQGSGVALVTPFVDNKVDYEKIAELIEWHIDNHTDAIIVCGTTGESATLSLEEKQKIIHLAVMVSNKRIPIIAGTGSNSTEASVKLSVFADEIGADGLLLVTPYYNKPTQKGLIAHFKKIAEAVTIPIILYNVPSRTAVNLLPETVYTLSQIQNIIAIKEASGDISQIAKIIELCGQDFYVYSGNDDQTIPILSLGGKGVISVTANIIPSDVHLIVNEYLTNNHQEAVRKFIKMRLLNQMLFIETNPTPVKTAMNLMGLNVGGCRLPLVEMDEVNIDKLKYAMKEYGLIIK